jgi:excisionase family DNA binding protein
MKHGTRSPETPTGDSAQTLLLTADETAALLRTSRTAIYAMVARGQLPGIVRIGRRVLFRRLDLIRWIDDLTRMNG